jgi:hypothetical protein
MANKSGVTKFKLTLAPQMIDEKLGSMKTYRYYCVRGRDSIANSVKSLR